MRAERQAAGLCRNCGADAGNYARCDKCREKLRLRYWFRQMSLYWARQREQEQQPDPWQPPEGMTWHWTGEEYELIPTPAK